MVHTLGTHASIENDGVNGDGTSCVTLPQSAVACYPDLCAVRDLNFGWHYEARKGDYMLVSQCPYDDEGENEQWVRRLVEEEDNQWILRLEDGSMVLGYIKASAEDAPLVFYSARKRPMSKEAHDYEDIRTEFRTGQVIGYVVGCVRGCAAGDAPKAS